MANIKRITFRVTQFCVRFHRFGKKIEKYEIKNCDLEIYRLKPQVKLTNEGKVKKKITQTSAIRPAMFWSTWLFVSKF